MLDTKDYIGIPHVFLGESHEGCDCIGLARLFYKEHDWPEDIWDGGEEVTEDNYNTSPVWRRLLKELRKDFDEVRSIDELKEGATVLFLIDGDYHIGIYAGDGWMLTMEIPVRYGKSRSMLYHKRYWKMYFKRGFNRR